MAPPPDTDQVTAVFAAPSTFAVNCRVVAGLILVPPGVTDSDTGIRVSVAVPKLAPSASLVAVMVIVWDVVITEVGAEYTPELLMLPTAGLRDHVTDVFPVYCTVAENCCVCPWPIVAVPGETLT